MCLFQVQNARNALRSSAKYGLTKKMPLLRTSYCIITENKLAAPDVCYAEHAAMPQCNSECNTGCNTLSCPVYGQTCQLERLQSCPMEGLQKHYELDSRSLSNCPQQVNPQGTNDDQTEENT